MCTVQSPITGNYFNPPASTGRVRPVVPTSVDLAGHLPWTSVMALSRSSVADSTTRDESVDPDRLFVGLDGREVSVAGHDWRVNVFGVRDLSGRRWVQVAVDGSKYYMLTLCLSPGAGVPQALIALAGWLQNPSSTAAAQILRVG